MTTAKQTAGNNATLAAVRKLMNDAIYRQFASIYNATGEGDALQYLSRHFNTEGWTRVLKTIPQAQTRDRMPTCPGCGEAKDINRHTGACNDCSEAAYDRYASA